MISLTTANITDYLRETGRIESTEAVVVRELSGGVSNTVLLVERSSQERNFVLKQALPRLKVQQEWLCSIERIWREVEVLRICGDLLKSSSDDESAFSRTSVKVAVPQVLFEDRENYLYAMTAAPAEHQTWKEMLLAGEIDLQVATACSNLLGRLHAGSWHDPQIAQQLEDRTFFDDLRLAPYYRRLMEVYPDLRSILEELIAATWNTRLSLVHGDFSPKNLLVSPDQLMLIDFEVGHFGDPAFDLGFFLTHLTLKGFLDGSFRTSPLFQAITTFWEAYWLHLLPVASSAELVALQARACQHWSACLLARVDGKSPVDYLTPELQQTIRQTARALLVQPASTISRQMRRMEA